MEFKKSNDIFITHKKSRYYHFKVTLLKHYLLHKSPPQEYELANI